MNMYFLFICFFTLLKNQCTSICLVFFRSENGKPLISTNINKPSLISGILFFKITAVLKRR